MPTTTHDIVAKLWNLSNVLKDDGVTYHQYGGPPGGRRRRDTFAARTPEACSNLGTELV